MTNLSPRRIPFGRSVLAASVLCAGLGACGGGSSNADGGTAATASDAKEGALATTATWTKIASEGGSFTVSTNQRVRYGFRSSWIEKTISGKGQCTNEFFGADPAVGQGKECDVMTSTTPTTGTATVTWDRPLTNVDGSTLTDLAGFRVYMGTAPGAYSSTVTVSDPAATAYTFQNLTAGTYYFSIRAFDTSNNESAASNLVSKTIQ